MDKLVYFEQTQDIYSAMEREKRLKKWNRQWKIVLIEKTNPEWRDLYHIITGNDGSPIKALKVLRTCKDRRAFGDDKAETWMNKTFKSVA